MTGQFTGLPVLLLTTIGAKSGKPRTTPLVYLHDRNHNEDRYLIVASKAGAPTNPAWYHNLLATPTASVETGTELFDVSARITHDDERDRLFHQVATRYPIYQDYQHRTERRIPLVVLKRLGR